MVPIFLFFVYVPAIEEKMTHVKEGKRPRSSQR
jgi:hypothetical protein